MKFPERTDQHIIEDEAMRILANNVPAEWVVREITKRDYGIDCYVEIVTKSNEITGDMAFIQVKGQQKIDWQQDGIHSYKLGNIKTSSVNYWFNIPVPVFIVVVDISSSEVFFCNVKKTIRQHYDNYLKSEEISFYLNKANMIDRSGKWLLFFVNYYLEMNYKSFSFNLISLFSHLEQYMQLFEEIGYDEFMEVEETAHLSLISLYESCRILADRFGLEWQQKPLIIRYREDKEMFKDDFWSLHEISKTRILVDLYPTFIKVIERSCEFVIKSEPTYFQWTNLPLFNHCLNFSVTNLKARLDDLVNLK